MTILEQEIEHFINYWGVTFTECDKDNMRINITNLIELAKIQGQIDEVKQQLNENEREQHYGC